MTDLVQKVTLGRATTNQNIPNFKAGDTVGVYVRVREGEKERVQLYKGTVLRIQGAGMSRSFTVRKMSSGVGVERTFPFVSPIIDRVELIAVGKVRRSRLFYLRKLRGKAATIVSEMASQGESAEARAAAAAKSAANKSAGAAATDEPVAGTPGTES